MFYWSGKIKICLLDPMTFYLHNSMSSDVDYNFNFPLQNAEIFKFISQWFISKTIESLCRTVP